ncbi:MAG TPA: substrate-binding domain-containing protein [Streptosporangiaceae bacterium]|nr:substrate-binding domain-containing protein [Streptosporangiaceae bacterium]
MGHELTHVPCPECGTSGDSDPEQSHWQCSNCGNGFFLRRCTACSMVSYVDGLQGFHTPWPCTWCGQYNHGFSQNQDPAAAIAAELAAEVHRYGRPGSPAAPDTGVRDRTPAHDMAVAVGPASAGERSPRHGQVPTPTPGTWHFMRKRGVLAGAAVMVAVAGTLAATLGSPNHGGSNKPPLPTKLARPTLRQTSTAAVIACASGSIELIGSSTFGPVVKAAASIYTRQCRASIKVVYGDVGGKGIDSAYGAATVNAAVRSKPARAGSMIAMYNGVTSIAPFLTPDPLGVLIFSVVAHTGLYPGSDIRVSELKRLFLQGGEPGKVAVGRQAGTGTRITLVGFLQRQGPGPQASGNSCPPPAGSAVCTEYSNTELLSFVNETRNAIGYAEVDQQSDGHPAGYPDASVLSINGIAPTPANVRNGSYNFATVANLYMPPHPSALAKSFYQYLLQYIAANQSDGLITCSGVPKRLEANC